MLDRQFLIKLMVVALLVAVAQPARAELKNSYQSKGNNIGFSVRVGFGGPFNTADLQHQFPRGSGNMYTYGRWQWGVNVARDLNGDGVPEDTMTNRSRNGTWENQRQSLEFGDALAAAAAGGERMSEFAGRITSNRVWTSTDAEDLADWPVEFREGRNASGEPILHGAETIVCMLGNAFTETQDAVGASVEVRAHFLNFAESNNMVYAHVFFRNMSEYIKWNFNQDVRAQVANTPDGQVWHGVQMVYGYGNGCYSGNGNDEAWLYYFPLGIIAHCDANGVESSFTTPPAAVAAMHFENPKWNGQEMKFTNAMAHRWNSEFGGPTPLEVLEGGQNPGGGYRYGNGKYDPYAPSAFLVGYTSPWTGGTLYGWPGVLEPGDPRYNQWIWGTKNNQNSYNFWSEFKDFAPQDSFSVDWVAAFVMPANPPYAFPQSVIAEIDNPSVQTQMQPIIDYMNVARIVRDGGFILPETPTPPPLTIIPGDKQVTITWSDVNLNTPDAYYGFLQQYPELDPNGLYRQYDFEGYRLYRSFVGPSDSHSQLLWEGSLSGENLQFYYIDTQAKDEPYYRMQNGMHVWYALVAYDRNLDPVTGVEFSLPEAASGKTWNRPASAPLYTVEARSNASNFREATFGSVAYTPFHGGTLTEGIEAELRGEAILDTLGNIIGGKLLDAPKLLSPMLSFELDAVTSEKITQDQTVVLVCTGMESFDFGGCNWPTGTRGFELQTSGGARISTPPLVRGIHQNGGATSSELVVHGPVDAAGAAYALKTTFDGLAHGNAEANLYNEVDAGGYAGATIGPARYRCGAQLGSAPNNMGWVTSAKFSLTWGAAANGELTLAVKNLTTGADVPFGQYPDDMGWGIAPGAIIGDRWGSGDNIYNELSLPKAERTSKLLESLPADNTEGFGIYLNGIFWVFSDLTAMPAPGTVMTITTAWGSWNGDRSIFTQEADAPLIGDKWTIQLRAMTLNAEDANLSQIMVVPNPYMASSFLDLSPDSRRIEFVNLPDQCTIRIYSMGGHLVNVLNHVGANRFGWGNYTDWDRLDNNSQPKEFTGYDNHSGTEPWNLRNRFGQTVASGLYFFHVTDSRGETRTGKFYIIN